MKLRGALLWAALAASAADQRPIVELEQLLKAPVSPGVAALLVPHASDDRAQQRLREALNATTAETRAAAARATHVAYAKTLVAALQDVLANETNAEAAREQLRALASLGGPNFDPALREAAKRFAGRLDAALLEALARTRGPDAIPVIVSEEWSRTVLPQRRAELLLIGARDDYATLTASIQALVDRKDAATWKALLRTPVRRRKDLPISLIQIGLRSSDPEIAGITAWELAKRNATKGTAAAELLSQEWKPPEGADADTIFAFELLARSMGGRRRSQPAWVASLETAESSLADDVRPKGPILGLMEPVEREAARKRFVRRFPKPEYPPSAWDPPAPTPSAKVPQETPILRVVSNLPRGLVEDTLAASGCKPKKNSAVGAAEVYYNVEGRPGRVRRIDAGASKKCDAAATALFLMSLVPRSHLPGVTRPQIVLAFADPECVQTLGEPGVPELPQDQQDAEAIPVAYNVRPPQLVRKVAPSYPEKSRQELHEGAVILEAVITRDGCVSEIETIRGVDPVLDYAAARAVSQWRYQPATLDGKPVQVYLTVTVTFNLH